MYETYASNNFRKFRRQFPDAAVPNTIICNYVDRFRPTAYILDRKRTAQKIHAEEKLNETGARLDK
jgi:hypothetical protein